MTVPGRAMNGSSAIETLNNPACAGTARIPRSSTESCCCKVDALFVPRECYYPFKRTVRSRIHLEAIY